MGLVHMVTEETVEWGPNNGADKDWSMLSGLLCGKYAEVKNGQGWWVILKVVMRVVTREGFMVDWLHRIETRAYRGPIVFNISDIQKDYDNLRIK